MPAAKKNYHLLIVSLLSMLVYLALFFFRNLDDDRLTSWQWAFQNASGAKVFALLAGGIVAAFLVHKLAHRVAAPAATLFIFSFAVSLPFWREPEVIVDASRYFTQAKHLEVYGIGYFMREWGRGFDAWTDMPLVPFLYGLIFRFIGEERVYIEIFTTLLFSSSVVITYLIGRTLWDEDTGYYGGLLLMGMPYLLTQVPLMLVDVPTMFFFILAVFAFVKAVERGGWRTVAAAAAIFAAFYAKYSTWLMLSVLAAVFLSYLVAPSVALAHEELRRRRLAVLRRAALTLSLSVLTIGILFFYKVDVFNAQMKLLVAYQKPGLERWGESFLSTFFFQIHPFISLAALFSIYYAVRKRDPKYFIVAWLVFLVLAMQIRRIRYTVMIFPMVTLMASYGLQRVRDKEVRSYIAECVIVFSVVVAVFAYVPFLERISTVNLKDAGEYLDSLKEENVEVFTLFPREPAANMAVAVPLLDLFTAKKILYDYHKPTERFEKIEKSPLRFTWQYRNPGFYRDEASYGRGEKAVAVISDSVTDALPEGVRGKVAECGQMKAFRTDEGIFAFRTCVRVYSDCR